MALYFRLNASGDPVGFPVSRPKSIAYTDPGSGEQTVIRASGLSDAELLNLGNYARVDPEFSLQANYTYVPGGTLDEETGLVTPNTAELSLASIKSKIKADVKLFTNALRNQWAGDATTIEITAWPVKAERAKRILDETATAEDIAIVQAEATARDLGESVNDLAVIQNTKALLLSNAVALIDGSEDAVLTSIDGAADAAAAATVSDNFKAALVANLAGLLGGG